MAYQPQPQQTEGDKKEAVVSDDNTQEILGEILKQLKIMNIHLSILTDTEIEKQEVD